MFASSSASNDDMNHNNVINYNNNNTTTTTTTTTNNNNNNNKNCNHHPNNSSNDDVNHDDNDDYNITTAQSWMDAISESTQCLRLGSSSSMMMDESSLLRCLGYLQTLQQQIITGNHNDNNHDNDNYNNNDHENNNDDHQDNNNNNNNNNDEFLDQAPKSLPPDWKTFTLPNSNDTTSSFAAATTSTTDVVNNTIKDEDFPSLMENHNGLPLHPDQEQQQQQEQQLQLQLQATKNNNSNPYAILDYDDDDDDEDAAAGDVPTLNHHHQPEPQSLQPRGRSNKEDNNNNNNNNNNHANDVIIIMDCRRLLIRIVTCMSEVHAALATLKLKNEPQQRHNNIHKWMQAAEHYTSSLQHIHNALLMADTKVSLWISLGKKIPQVFCQDATIVEVAIRSLTEQRDKYIRAAHTQMTKLEAKLQPQWQSRNVVKQKMGIDRWKNNPHPSNYYANLRKDMEDEYAAIQKALTQIETTNATTTLMVQEQNYQLKQKLGMITTTTTNTTTIDNNNNYHHNLELYRYNQQRLTAVDLAERVSLELYPIPTDIHPAWVFTGSCPEHGIEFYEQKQSQQQHDNNNKNNEDHTIVLLRLEWYFRIGAIQLTSLYCPQQQQQQQQQQKAEHDRSNQNFLVHYKVVNPNEYRQCLQDLPKQQQQQQKQQQQNHNGNHNQKNRARQQRQRRR